MTGGRFPRELLKPLLLGELLEELEEVVSDAERIAGTGGDELELEELDGRPVLEQLAEAVADAERIAGIGDTVARARARRIIRHGLELELRT